MVMWQLVSGEEWIAAGKTVRDALCFSICGNREKNALGARKRSKWNHLCTTVSCLSQLSGDKGRWISLS